MQKTYVWHEVTTSVIETSGSVHRDTLQVVHDKLVNAPVDVKAREKNRAALVRIYARLPRCPQPGSQFSQTVEIASRFSNSNQSLRIWFELKKSGALEPADKLLQKPFRELQALLFINNNHKPMCEC